MPFPLAPLIAAGGALLGGVFSGNSARRAQEDANETNLQIARENNRNERQMAASAYQIAALDMRAAGLNPAVMFNQGAGGASVPSLESPHMESTQKDAARIRMDSLTAAAGLAESSARASQAQAQAALMRRQTKRISSEEMLMSAQAQSAKEQSMTLEAARPRIGAESKFEADYLNSNSALERTRRILLGPSGSFLDVGKLASFGGKK